MIEINRQWMESTISKSDSLNTALVDYIEKPTNLKIVEVVVEATKLINAFNELKARGYDFNLKQSL